MPWTGRFCCIDAFDECLGVCSDQEELQGDNLLISSCLQGNGTADGYGNFVGMGSLDSYDGYFQGSGTFMGAGDCEGSQVFSS